MSINNSQRTQFPNELSAAMTGSPVLIGTLLFNPVIMYFNNQGIVNISISVNDPTGTNVWMTFTPGLTVAMDLRDKAHLAQNFCPDKGTTFYGNGASGTFSISYVSAMEPTS